MTTENEKNLIESADLKPAELIAQGRSLAASGEVEQAIACYEKGISARSHEGKKPFKQWIEDLDELKKLKDGTVSKVEYRTILNPEKFSEELQFLKSHEIKFRNQVQVGLKPKEVVSVILAGVIVILRGAITFKREAHKEVKNIKEDQSVPEGLKDLSQLLLRYKSAKKNKEKSLARECQRALGQHLPSNLKELSTASCPGSQEAVLQIAWINAETARGIAGFLITLLLKEDVRNLLRSTLNQIDASTQLKVGKKTVHVFPELLEELQKALVSQGFRFETSESYAERYKALREVNSLEKGQTNLSRTKSLLAQATGLLSDSTSRKKLTGSSEVDQEVLLNEIQTYLEKVSEQSGS